MATSGAASSRPSSSSDLCSRPFHSSPQHLPHRSQASPQGGAFFLYMVRDKVLSSEISQALKKDALQAVKAWLSNEKEELAIRYLVGQVIDQENLPMEQQKQARLAAAAALNELHRWDDALEILDPCLPPSFEELEFLFLFIELLARSGRAEAAYSWIEQAMSRQLSEVKLLRVLIYWSIAAERPDLCRMYLDELSKHPQAAQLVVLLGADLLTAESNHESAVQLLVGHLSEFGSSRRYRLRLVKSYRSALLTQKALSELESIGQLFGFDGHVRRGLIELATEEPALSRAWQLLDDTDDSSKDWLYFHQRGVICFYRRQWDECERFLLTSIQCSARPDRETIVMLSELLRLQGRYGESLRFLKDYLSLFPGDASLEFAVAYDYLSLHQWKSGWSHYESRLKVDQSTFPMGLNADWSGESLHEKRVLVLCEQGLGDVIMCASQLKLLDQVAADWRIIGFPQLYQIFAQSFGSDRFCCELSESEISAFDVRVGICSLPGIFKFGQSPNIYPTPCLSVADQDVFDWRSQLLDKANTPHVVGFTWFGGSNAMLRRRRSLELKQLLPLFKLSGITWISLQYGGPEVENELSDFSLRNCLNILSYPDTCSNLYQQAALIKALDLTISVQQTVVHVAGAVGAKAWALLPTAPEWRYGVAGDMMPWYPTIRLFRQAEAFEWAPTIYQVRSELIKFLGVS